MSVDACVREGCAINARAGVKVVLCDFKGGINIKSRRRERYCLNMTKHISIVQLIVCRSATGVCIQLKVLNDSNLATLLSCSIITTGASYRSCILRWWPSNIEKKKFFDQLIGQDGDLNVLSGGTLGLQRRQRNVPIFMVNPFMGNPKVLMALYEELMTIRFCCPCQVSYLDRIWENMTVLLFYSNFISRVSNQNLALLLD
jgi:hypothetical protein